LEGVLVAVYPIDSIIIAQSLVEQPKGLSFTLFEGDSKDKLRLVYHLTPKIGSEQVVEDPDLIYTSNFSIAEKNFMVEVKPNDHFIMKNKGANLFWVMVSGYLFSFFVAFVIYRYLTGRRFEKLVEEIEEETRKKNFAIIREFLNSSVDMNGMKLPLGDPISFNNVFAEFFTGEKFDRLPEPHELKIIPELLPHLNAFDDQILPDSEVVLYQFEYRDCVFDVRKFPVNIDNDEYCIGFIIRDITTEINQLKEILKYSDRLEANNRTKNKFFSIIAHDLRSPFQGILGFLEVVLDEFDDITDAEKKEMLSKILVSTRNIYDLLDNLLEWSRTQTDRIPTRLQNIPMKEIVELLSGLYTVSADKKNIDIVNKITEDFSVYADLNMVRTIFRNLVSNAIKFTKPGGKITLDAIFVPDPQNGSEPQILFSVADNGVGIEADMLDKIFRIDEKTVTPGTQNEKGTGLGLILCKEFVERIGGSIWIESTPGKGSTFFFTLPVSKTPEMSS
jgi:signal transduction histidine kinase